MQEFLVIIGFFVIIGLLWSLGFAILLFVRGLQGMELKKEVKKKVKAGEKVQLSAISNLTGGLSYAGSIDDGKLLFLEKKLLYKAEKLVLEIPTERILADEMGISHQSKEELIVPFVDENGIRQFPRFKLTWGETDLSLWAKALYDDVVAVKKNKKE